MGLPFLRPRSKRRDQIISVDLGGRTTKAVFLQRRGNHYCIKDYTLHDAPITENGVNAETLAHHLSEVTKGFGGGRTKQFTLAINSADSLFRHIEMPLMPITDMRRLLKFNAKNYLQQDLHDFVFDCSYVVSNRNGNPHDGAKQTPTNQKQKVIVGGVKKNLMEDIETAITEAGLLADQVVPGLVGPINAFELAEPEVFSKEVVALVDIGYKNTSISILDCGEFILNRVVAIGGDRLTAGLADALSISYEEAENIKVGMTSEILQNLELILNPLGRELRASIDFFEHQRDKTVAQVFISGGTSRNEVILQVLQNELMIPCKSWSPTKNFEVDLPPEKASGIENDATQLTVALGAAAAGF